MSTGIPSLSDPQGFIGACRVGSDTGLLLASELADKFDLEAAAAANTEVDRAKNAAIEALGLKDGIEDITPGPQYHLIRPLAADPSGFIYAALDRKHSNPGMARIKVKAVEGELKV